MDDVLVWCFDHFYHLDLSNAAVHCAPVRFSPITFRLATAIGPGMPDVDVVLGHVGAYAEDRGR